MAGLSKNQLVKALAYMLSSNFLVLGIFLATTVVMARMMSPEHFGMLMAGEAFVALFSFVFALGFRNAMYRISAKHADGLTEGLNTAIGTGLMIKSISLIPAAFLVYGVALLTKPSPDELYVICCYIFVESMEGFAKLFGVVRRALGEFKLISIINTTNKFLRLVMIFVVLKYFGGWKLLVTLFAFFSIFKFLISYFSTIRLFQPRVDMTQVVPMLKDSLGFGLYDSLDDAQGRIDRVLLNSMLGPVAVAFYAIPARLNRLTKIIPTTINQVFLPTLYETYEHAQDRFLNLAQHISRFFALTGAVIFLAVYYFSDFVVLNLFGAQYAGSLVIVRVFAYATLLLFLDKAPNLILAVRGEHIKRIGSLVGSTIIFIAVNLWLIPIYGISGAVYAAIIASAARLLFLACFTHKQISFIHLILIAGVPAALAPFVPAWILIPAYPVYLWLSAMISREDIALLSGAFKRKG